MVAMELWVALAEVAAVAQVAYRECHIQVHLLLAQILLAMVQEAAIQAPTVPLALQEFQAEVVVQVAQEMLLLYLPLPLEDVDL